jgi:hypothetical protein
MTGEGPYDVKDRPEHAGVRIQYIQSFICTSCASGGPDYDEIFKSTGQCRSCGAPGGKIELEEGERVVDLHHAVLAIHQPNPSQEVIDFISQLRAHHVLPADQAVVFAVKPVEKIVQTTPYILAFWTPEINNNPLANLTMDSALLMGHRIVPLYPTKKDFDQSPPMLATRAGSILTGPGTEEMRISPQRVIEQIVQTMTS